MAANAFNILQLANLPMEDVFKYMTPSELFSLSTISKKTKIFVKMFSQRQRFELAFTSDERQWTVGFRYKNCHDSCFNINLKKSNRFKLSGEKVTIIGATVPVSIVSNQNGHISGIIAFSMNRNALLLRFLIYFTSIFKISEVSTKLRDENEESIRHFLNIFEATNIKLSDVYFSAQNASSNILKKVLDHSLPTAKTIEIETNEMSENFKYELPNELKKSYIIPLKSFKVANSSWVTLDLLWGMNNCESISLNNTALDMGAITNLMDYRMKGNMCFHKLRLGFNNFSKTDLKDIVGGLGTLRSLPIFQANIGRQIRRFQHGEAYKIDVNETDRNEFPAIIFKENRMLRMEMGTLKV